MNKTTSLRISGTHHRELRSMLYPGDGVEHVAILACGRHAGADRHVLTVQAVHAPPVAAYRVQNALRVTWETEWLVPHLENAAKKYLALIKVHSHPGGLHAFSETDDESDQALAISLRDWIESDAMHASVIMLPDGELFGRVLRGGRVCEPIDRIMVAGPDIRIWDAAAATPCSNAFEAQLLAFGDKIQAALQTLRVGVVGCSGTGSPVIENLVRLGVGELMLVEDDFVEDRNLNRIIHATQADANANRKKVEVISDSIKRTGLPTRVTALPMNLVSPVAIDALADCDIVFGCMDSVEGRFVLNMLATHYVIPYFDLGVRIDVRPSECGNPRISEVAASVHYLQPGRSSLLSRRVITMEGVKAEGLRRTDPQIYEEQVRSGYVHGADVKRPAVAPVNMNIASVAVSDLIARLSPYRQEPYDNDRVACIRVSLASLDFITEVEPKEACPVIGPHLGKGDVDPLLGLPMLSRRCAA